MAFSLYSNDLYSFTYLAKANWILINEVDSLNSLLKQLIFVIITFDFEFSLRKGCLSDRKMPCDLYLNLIRTCQNKYKINTDNFK